MNRIAHYPQAGLLMALLLLIPACEKDKGNWSPDARLVIEPDSGLTTQVFDLSVNILNLPSSHRSVFLRWDLDGDSIWDVPFTADQATKHRFYQKGTHRIRVELLTEDGQNKLIYRNVKVEQGYSSPQVHLKIDPAIGHYRTEFTFDASQTFDDEDAYSDLQFRWDFENDGVWDTESGHLPVVTHTYPSPGNYTVRLSVTDPTRRTATLTRVLEVNR
ncbi:MAG: PKD domain-containing protein, partial [Bacteroidales bacterium]